MPSTTTISFDDISNDPGVAVPAGYEGFNWTGYDPITESFGGDVHTASGGQSQAPGKHSLKGLGFKMTSASGSKFEVHSAIIAADSGFSDNGAAAMDVTLIGRVSGNEVFRKILNRSTGYDQGPTEVKIDCKDVDEFEFIASAAEAFDVDNVKVTIGE